MRKILCFVLILSLALPLGGCGLMDWIFPDKDPEPLGDDGYGDEIGPDEGSSARERNSVLYVASSQGNYVLPVSYDIPWEEGIAKAVIRHLVEGGPAHQYLTTMGLKAVLPAGTSILGMTVKDGLAVVDFSPQLLQTADAVHERLILDALTYTLTEFSTIDKVTIWVNGHTLTKMTHGTPVEPILTRDRGVNTLASSKGTGVNVTIYLGMDSMAGGLFLVPVTRPVASAAELSSAALEQLIGGPAAGESGLKGVISSGVRVQRLSIEGKTAVVDFSADLAQAENLDAAVGAIVLTLTELPDISGVKLTVDGENITLTNGEVLTEPVLRPASTNPLAL